MTTEQQAPNAKQTMQQEQTLKLYTNVNVILQTTFFHQMQTPHPAETEQVATKVGTLCH